MHNAHSSLHNALHTAHHIPQKTKVTVSNRLLADTRELVQRLSNSLASEAFLSSSNCTKIRFRLELRPKLPSRLGGEHPLPRLLSPRHLRHLASPQHPILDPPLTPVIVNNSNTAANGELSTTVNDFSQSCPWVGLGWEWIENFCFQWVGLGRGSEMADM